MEQVAAARAESPFSGVATDGAGIARSRGAHTVQGTAFNCRLMVVSTDSKIASAFHALGPARERRHKGLVRRIRTPSSRPCCRILITTSPLYVKASQSRA